MEAYTIVAKPAAGPLTPKGEPLKVPTTIPPMIPDINPEIGGAPEAIAIPKHNGRATKKTTILAGMSFLKFLKGLKLLFKFIFNILTFSSINYKEKRLCYCREKPYLKLFLLMTRL
jgi:hypothetical protein